VEEKEKSKMRKVFPNDIKQEVLKMHYAGKRHNNICKAIKRKHSVEMSEVDVYKITMCGEEVEERNKSHD
jgi:hypothetical protein